MSGLVKSVKKVFKKVGKALKKIALPLLAVGAIVFSGGAALGLPAMAGGWGGAVTKGLSALGISGNGAIGSALTGALTKAGTGAAMGGVLSAATGGSFQEGAAQGGLAGAVLGGIGGALTPAATGAALPAATVPTAQGLGTAATAAAPAATALPAMGTTGAVAQTASSGFGSFLKSPVVGQMVSGLGQGLMAGMSAKSAEEAEQRNYDRINDNYDLDVEDYAISSVPMPKKRKRIQYNVETGMIESV